jgi:hypothetical protein
MEEDAAAYYKITQNIDASKTSQWNGGNGFAPIEKANSNIAFGGVLYGNDKIIKGLTIDDPFGGDQTGLFGSVAGDKVLIQNLTLDNATVNGDGETGILVGQVRSSAYSPTVTIKNVNVSGSVSSASDSKNLGGVVGEANDNLDLINVDSTANVDGGTSVTQVGGIIGHTDSTIDIKRSSSTGNVKGQLYVGGIAGTVNSANISNSYATGDLTANGYVGGIAGQAFSSSNITKSYGAVTLKNDPYGAGGTVGYLNESSSIDSSYWDSTKETNSVGYIGSNSTNNTTGLTTSEMQGSSAETNMSAFDFTSIWKTVSGDYPELQ